MTTYLFKAGLLACCVGLVASPLIAKSEDGVRADRIMATDDLEKECQTPENTDLGLVNQAHCLGFLVGVADATMTLNAVIFGAQTICLEENDNAESMRLSFLAFVQRNPEARTLPAATSVISMLGENYRCEINPAE